MIEHLHHTKVALFISIFLSKFFNFISLEKTKYKTQKERNKIINDSINCSTFIITNMLSKNLYKRNIFKTLLFCSHSLLR